MKFLGIRNGHDANITYTDDTKIRYLKLERNLQQKHYNWGHRAGDDYAFLIEQAQKILGVSFKGLDAIALSNDGAHHKLARDLRPNELHIPVIDDPLFKQFGCPVFQLDHHYTHALSCWPLVDIKDVDAHFVFDGLGDHGRVSTIFRNDWAKHRMPPLLALRDYIDRTENNGLSVTMERIGEAYGMHGMVLDMSGKIMALQSFHTLSNEKIAEIMALAAPMSYRHLNQFINLANSLITTTDPKQNLIDLAHLLHRFGQEKLDKYFLQFANPSTDLITYSGGTAQNTVVNTDIKYTFPTVVIPPHCPDDGLSLGCVEFLRIYFEQPLFSKAGFPYWQSDERPKEDPTRATIKQTAELLAQGKIVGWYQGYGEIGPRALGNRSILMNPTLSYGKDYLNNKVKHREPYRPFGASVLLREAPKYFDWLADSPYMLYVVNCKDPKAFAPIVHVDGTCRIQTVSETDPATEIYANLLGEFEKLTGIPMLLNTSLNVDGKPIAGHMADAQQLYQSSGLDALVMGNDTQIK